MKDKFAQILRREEEKNNRWFAKIVHNCLNNSNGGASFYKVCTTYKNAKKDSLLLNCNYENDVKCAEMIYTIGSTLKENVIDRMRESSF